MDIKQLKRKMTDQMNATYRNANISIEDLLQIMQMARDLYALDIVFIATNKGYKYYLQHEAVVGNDDEIIKRSDHIALTREQYKEISQNYIKQTFLETPIAPANDQFVGTILHTGIMRKEKYFGTVGFWVKNERKWTEEEKQTLLDLKQLTLIYLSMNHLMYGLTLYKQTLQQIQDKKVLSAFYLNIDTGKYHVIKLFDHFKTQVSEWGNYSDLLQFYLGRYIDPVYGKLMSDDFDLNMIKKNISFENPVLYMEYPRMLDHKVYWIRFKIELFDKPEDQSPCRTIVTFLDITEEVEKRALLSKTTTSDSKTYLMIAAVDLDTGRYGIYVDNRNQATPYDGYGRYKDLISNMVKHNFEPEYADHFVNTFSIETMRIHFSYSTQALQYEFPFQTKEKMWIRLEAVKSQKFSENNKKILLYFSDITTHKRREIQLEERKALLEKENKLKKYQLEHDSLTGVYNRQGYNNILEQCKKDKKPIAYIQIDIDHFKTVNDSYGHAFGDIVLKQVAQQLMDTFRSEDYVFRFGGDEFAVLLMNCKADAWDTIGAKQNMIHIRMNQHLHKPMYVTLSMGIYWSSSGFHHEMVALADEALYHTKKNGKAGCSVIDKNHTIIYEWNDEMGELSEANPLAQCNTGAYRMEFPHGDLSHGRLICNEITRALMGLKEGMTPEENYRIWVSRLDLFFKDMVKRTRDQMIELGQAECTYAYMHPTQGRIMVRSGGKSIRNKDGIVFYGYHQSLKDTKIVLHEYDSQKLITAMNHLYFCSYYIDLNNDRYCTFKATKELGKLESREGSASVSIQKFVKILVSPEHKNAMADFVDFNTLPKRLKDKPFVEQEYLSITEKGWCRARFIPVDYNEKGNLSHVQFLIASIDQAKRAEIEYHNKLQNAMKLQIRIGEITCRSTIMQTGLMNKETGVMRVWNHMNFMQADTTYRFEDVKAVNLTKIKESEKYRFEHDFDLTQITTQVEKNGSYLVSFDMKNKDGLYDTISIYFEECKTDSKQLLIVCEK